MSHRAPGPPDPDLASVLPGCIHEVNTLVWLREVSARAGRALTLADVPDERVGRRRPRRGRLRVAHGRVDAQPCRPRGRAG